MPALDQGERTRAAADALRRRIVTGRCSPGTFLPSERRLAVDLGVARNTVRSALRLLDKEGYVTRARGRGAMVRPRVASRLGGVVPLVVQQHVTGGLAPFSPEMTALVAGALGACGGSDVRFLLQTAPSDGAAGLIGLVRASDAPGLLLVECDDADILAALRSEGIPYAVINQEYDIPGPASRVDSWHVGRLAAEHLLDLGHQRSGYHIAHWDGKDDSGQSLSSGIYFYILRTDDGFSDTKKMVLLK